MRQGRRPSEAPSRRAPWPGLVGGALNARDQAARGDPVGSRNARLERTRFMMNTRASIFLIGVALLLAGCLETMPRLRSADDLPALPTLRDRNAAVAEAWDRASLDCRSQHKPRGAFCEQLKTEGEFLACSSERFARAANALRYPANDKIWVWHHCVATTANLLRDGYYLSRTQIERRLAGCQARFDTEPEFPLRQSGFFAPLVAMLTTGDKSALAAVVPSDFGIQESQVALPTCAARFPPQAELRTEPRTVAVVLPPPAPPLPPPPPPPPQIIEVLVERAPDPPAAEVPKESKTEEPVKPQPKPRARSAVGAREVKATSGPGTVSRSPSTSTGLSSAPIMSGACPIPGACGPTVPVDAVGRR